MSEKQQRFMAACLHSDHPPEGCPSRDVAREFSHGPATKHKGGRGGGAQGERYATGGAVPGPPAPVGDTSYRLVRAKGTPVPRYAGGGPAEMPALIRQRAYAFAKKQGATDAQAAAFAATSVSIAYSESNFDPSAVGDGGNSIGLFQNNMAGGRGQGYSKAWLADPENNIALALPELWWGFGKAGADAAFARDPAGTVAEVSRIAQRPAASAHAQAVKNGVFAQGLQAALGSAPTGGGIIAPGEGGKSGLGAQALANNPGAAEHQQGPRLPVAGKITSLFGTPFNLDSGATVQGRAYQNFNKGVDIGADPGSPVTNVVNGTITFVGNDKAGWGNRVVVTTPDGFKVSYGHLDANSIANLRPGMTIEKGLRIGVVGAGGAEGEKSTGGHVSFDVQAPNGEPVNPAPWLGLPDEQTIDPAIRATYNPAAAPRPQAAGIPWLALSRPAGGGQVATQQGAPVGGIDPNIAKIMADMLGQISQLQERQRALQAQGQRNFDEQSELESIPDSIKTLQQSYAGLWATVKQTQPSGDSPVEIANAETARTNAIAGIANNANTLQQQQTANNISILNTSREILATAFGNDTARATLAFNIIKANQDAMQTYVGQLLQQGQINLQGAMDIVQATALAQTAEATRAVEVSKRAQLIDEINYRNAMSRLPKGQTHVPLLGPNDPLAGVMQKMGLPFQGIPVVQVDWDAVSPEAAFAAAERTVAPVREFPVAGVQQAAARNAQLTIPTPTQITPESVGGLPQTPDYGALLAQMPAMQSITAAPDLNGLLAEMLMGGDPLGLRAAQPKQAMPVITPAAVGSTASAPAAAATASVSGPAPSQLAAGNRAGEGANPDPMLNTADSRLPAVVEDPNNPGVYRVQQPQDGGGFSVVGFITDALAVTPEDVDRAAHAAQNAVAGTARTVATHAQSSPGRAWNQIRRAQVRTREGDWPWMRP